MGVRDLDRLRRLLGGEEARWLRERLRASFEQGGSLPARVTRREPTEQERELVDRLFGRRPSTGGASMSVSVSRLESVLREADVCDDLAEALAALDGPLTDRKAAAAERSARWEEARARIAERVHDRPWLGAWLDDLMATGLLKRFAKGDSREGRRLAERALRVVDAFPLDGVSLPELAARTYGDAHSLDEDRALGSLVVRAAARYGGLEDWRSADGRRECWAAVGVLCDELSAPVLTLGLGGAGEGLTDRTLEMHRLAGEATSLGLRQLVRHRPRLDHLAGRAVFVCENPTVVAVAVERLGAGSAPLVCTSGQPRAATRVLLRLLADAGARLRVRADFDIDGLHIAGKGLALPRAAPWRLSAEDYLGAKAGPKLRREEVPPTPWDPRLRDAMSRRGVGVHEEALLDALLEDLAR